MILTKFTGVVTVQVGSVDTKFTARNGKKEEYPSGIAHFLEHKLFERENAEDIMAAFTETRSRKQRLYKLYKYKLSFFNL